MPIDNPSAGGGKEQYTKIVGFDAATCDYVCDGVADEVQWNQAIAAVATLGGGTVGGQRGLYDIAATINDSSFVDIHGSGENTILRASFAGPVFTGNNISHFKISNLQIDGNSVGTYGFYLDTCSYWTIQNCAITNFVNDGIYTIYNDHGTILNNRIAGCLGEGYNGSIAENYMKIVANNFSTCHRSVSICGWFGVVTDNMSQVAAETHFYFYSCGGMMVANNTIVDFGTANGIEFSNSSFCVCADNAIGFYAAPAFAISVTSSSTCVVKGNAMRVNAPTDGIRINFCYNIMVMANVLYMLSSGGG
jgi:hypothetical protein